MGRIAHHAGTVWLVMVMATVGLRPWGALASPVAEKVVCAQSDRATWLGEQRARTLFKAADYLLVRFKVSGGRCYEFYAIDHQNNVVEVYMDPRTGEVLRQTLIPAPEPTAQR